MTTHRITPSFTIRCDGGRLTVQIPFTKPLALIHGTVDVHTAGALRALADEIERGGSVAHTEHEAGCFDFGGSAGG